METKQFKFGEVIATAKYIGIGFAGWDGKQERPEYMVTVSHGGNEYTSRFWGSIADMAERGDQLHEEAAACVVDELCSAYCDPDEFWYVCIGEATAPTRERANEILDIIDIAARFGEVLIAAAEECRERELV